MQNLQSSAEGYISENKGERDVNVQNPVPKSVKKNIIITDKKKLFSTKGLDKYFIDNPLLLYVMGIVFFYYFLEVFLKMAVEIKIKGEVMTASLSGELDHHTARDMRNAIDNAVELNMPSLLILDFSGISFMDSSGIGLVMGRYRLISKNGAQLHITGASPQIYKVMRLAGLERLARLEKTF